MAQPSDNLRDRLLASLPQPENAAAYREETSTLIAKHNRALRWDYTSIHLVLIASIILFFFSSGNRFHLALQTLHFFQFASALMFVLSLLLDLRYRIYKSEIETLKELKQVQLQILELQASLQKEQ